jgi:hypothetical protein
VSKDDREPPPAENVLKLAAKADAMAVDWVVWARGSANIAGMAKGRFDAYLERGFTRAEAITLISKEFWGAR